MTDAWRRVDQVLQAALLRPADERDTFLRQACAGDTALENEVRSLLAADEQAGSFLDNPAIHTAARALADEQSAGGARRTDPLATGRRLGDYTILGSIGAGGMGEVYRARDTRLNRDVAIKVLPSFVSDDAQRLRRFEQEARAAAALSHPNILAVFQMGSDERTPYLVSELLDGSTLREQLQRGPLALRKVIDYGVQISRGLAAAHEKGIVHRDLKPENLFVIKDGRVKILDFGLARLVEQPWRALDTNVPTEPDATEPDATEPGMVIGTVGYMSPEQVRGHTADHRADIFAFGAILYEMLTGARAFRRATSVETMNAILNEDPPGVGQSAPAASPALQRVVQRCLEKNPEQRFQSASDLAFALEALSESTGASSAIRTARSRRVWPWAAVIVGVVALGGASGGYFYLHRMPVLTEKDTIVLADFANTTGDAVFDGTLRQGLSMHLQQTPFLRMLSADQIAQFIRLMEKPPDTPLTHAIAHEVCLRAGATVEVDGSIAPLGSQYVLGLTALHCQTGETLAQEQTLAKGKDDVLAALTTAASSLRSKLGESQASLRTYGVKLPQATTSSLEALQAASRGLAAFDKYDFRSAASELERAVKLDPNFATAHGVLATTHAFLGESQLAAEDARKAYALHERVSEFERLFILANYHLWGTVDLERALQSDLVWARTYPREGAAWSNLNYVYRLLGRTDEALAAALEGLRLNPDSGPNYVGPISPYLRQGHLDQVAATIRSADARHVAVPVAPQTYYYIAFLRRDEAAMMEQTGRMVPAARLVAQSGVAAYRGQLARSRDLRAHAIALATQAHQQERVSLLEARSALIEALFGNVAEARSAAARASRPSASWDAQSNAALALALAGEATEAERLAAAVNQRLPQATFVQFYYLPAIRAALALRRGKPEQAVGDLRTAASYDMAVNEMSSANPAMISVYLRGEALLAAHRGAPAAEEFRKILDHPGVVLDFPVGVLAHLGLGRAYVLSGDTAKARAAYEEFLTLWKDADPGIPVLKQARSEYATLH